MIAGSPEEVITKIGNKVITIKEITIKVITIKVITKIGYYAII